MVVTITYLLFNIVFMYSIFIFINEFLGMRKYSRQVILLTYIIYYIITAIIYFNIFNMTVNIIFHLCFCFAIGFLYKTSIFKRILAAVFIYILIISSDDGTLILLSIISKSSHETITGGAYLTCLDIILSMTSLLGIVTLIKPLFRNHDYELPNAYWLAFFLIPSGSIYILHTLHEQYLQGSIQNLPFMYLTMILLFIINIFMFYLYHKLIREEALKFENMILKQQNLAYENQTLLIEEFQSSLHELEHDMKNHLAIIMEFAKNGNTEKLLEYGASLIDMANEIEACFYSGNVTLDTMINSKLYLAKCQNITFKTNISLTQSLDINQVHLTSILYNVLDNAFEACLELQGAERKIFFSLSHDLNLLSIIVKNTYNPQRINLHKGIAYTTKTDKSIHGIGLRRIKKIIEKYDGTFEYYTHKNDEQSFFISEIMLYTSPKMK